MSQTDRTETRALADGCDGCEHLRPCDAPLLAAFLKDGLLCGKVGTCGRGLETC